MEDKRRTKRARGTEDHNVGDSNEASPAMDDVFDTTVKLDEIDPGRLIYSIRGLGAIMQQTDLWMVHYDTSAIVKAKASFYKGWRKCCPLTLEELDTIKESLLDQTHGTAQGSSFPQSWKATRTYYKIMTDARDANMHELSKAAARKLMDYTLRCLFHRSAFKYPVKDATFESTFSEAKQILGGPVPSAPTSRMAGCIENTSALHPMGEASPNVPPLAVHSSTIGTGLPTVPFPPTGNNSGVDLISKVNQTKITINANTTSMEDIVGLTDLKDDLDSLLAFPLLFPQLSKPGQDDTGILLHGPPGCGKTSLLTSLAKNYNSTVYALRASSLISQYLGQTEALLRAVVAEAIAQAPSIILIDDCDILTMARKEDSTSGSAMNGIVSELLQQFDLVAASPSQVVFVGATNRPWAMDIAFLRRFQCHVYVPLPDTGMRREMNSKQLQACDTQLHITGIELDSLARKSEGFSGADITLAIRAAQKVLKNNFMKAGQFTLQEGSSGSTLSPSAPDVPTYVPVVSLGSTLKTPVIKGTAQRLREKGHKLALGPLTYPVLMSSFADANPTCQAAQIERHKQWALDYGT